MGKFLRANRKKLFGLSQILLSIILLVWLLRQVGLAEVVKTLANIHWGWYAPVSYTHLTLPTNREV